MVCPPAQDGSWLLSGQRPGSHIAVRWLRRSLAVTLLKTIIIKNYNHRLRFGARYLRSASECFHHAEEQEREAGWCLGCGSIFNFPHLCKVWYAIKTFIIFKVKGREPIARMSFVYISECRNKAAAWNLWNEVQCDLCIAYTNIF